MTTAEERLRFYMKVFAISFYLAHFVLCLLTIGVFMTAFSLLVSFLLLAFGINVGPRKRYSLITGHYWTEPETGLGIAIFVFLFSFLFVSSIFLAFVFSIEIILVIFIIGLFSAFMLGWGIGE